MDRSTSRRYGWLLLVGMISLPVLGCSGPLATLAYLAGLNESPAAFAGLKNKKVVVVCRPTRQLEYSNKRPAAELAQRVSNEIRDNVSGVKMIPQQKVREWTDEHEWEEFPEVGKAVGADYVVGIDLDRYSLHQGQTILQGRAELAVRVYDMNDEKKLVFEKEPQPIVFPPRSGISTQERTEAAFNAQFIKILAGDIGRLFYRHDPRQQFAIDSTALGD